MQIASFSLSLLLCTFLFPTFAVRSAVAEPAFRFEEVQTILGPCCSDVANDLAIGEDGTVFLAGERGGLDLDRDGVLEVPAYGTPDAFVLEHRGDKLGPWEEENAAGEKVSWLQGPGSRKADQARGIALDREGGVYVVGTFSEEMEFPPIEITAKGNTDAFLARYDAQGEIVWAKALGGVAADSLFDVASDQHGNVYVVGTFRGEVDLDRNGAIDLEVHADSALLLASFSPGGGLRWAAASKSLASVQGHTLAVSPQGAVYAGGIYLNGTFDFDADGTVDGPEASPPGGNGPPDINGFIVRYTSEGSLEWVRAVSGPQIQVIGGIAVLEDEDIVVLGSSSADLYLNSDTKPDMRFTPLGSRRLAIHPESFGFLQRLSAAGKPRWAKRIMLFPHHLASQGQYLIVSGTYNGFLDVDDDGTHERRADSDEQQEGVVALFDTGGSLKQVFTVVGEDADVVNAAGISPDGRTLFATGYTKLNADFDGDGQTEAAAACHQLGDLFLARYALNTSHAAHESE